MLGGISIWECVVGQAVLSPRFLPFPPSLSSSASLSATGGVGREVPPPLKVPGRGQQSRVCRTFRGMIYMALRAARTAAAQPSLWSGG